MTEQDKDALQSEGGIRGREGETFIVNDCL